MTEESEFDLRLGWQAHESRRQTDEDTVAVSSDQQAKVHKTVDAATKESVVTDMLGVNEVGSLYLEDEDDEFQWTEDREQALEEALDESPEGSPPRVQRQLEAIMKGLQSDTLEPERTLLLLTEVEQYLTKKIATEKAKLPVDHADFTKSRKTILNALFSFQEAATSLRDYTKSRQPMQLKLASYAAEQGGSFMVSARELLMAAEPDYEEFEESSKG